MFCKVTLQLITIVAFLFCNSAFSDVRNEFFYKTKTVRQYITFGGDQKSDENSKEYELFLGYRYKSNKYICEIELIYETKSASTTTKPMRKTKELYEAEISGKALILNSNNYFNLYHKSSYDWFSENYYNITNTVGLGRVFFNGIMAADLNLGYNYVHYSNSEITINPTITIRWPVTKNINLSLQGYAFKTEQNYSEQTKSRLSFRLNDKISLVLAHEYGKERYFYSKYNTTRTKADRTYSVRIRYDF